MSCFIHTRWSSRCEECTRLGNKCVRCGAPLPIGVSFYHLCAGSYPAKTMVITVLA